MLHFNACNDNINTYLNCKSFLSFLQGGDGLLQSLTATSRNIGMLRLASLRLEDDIRSKSAASSIDGSIIRLRRRKSDHRWTLGAAF